MRLSGLVGRCLIVCALFGAPGFAFAAPFTNGSFELGPSPGSFITLGAGNTQIAGWLVSAGNIDYIGSLWQHADGSRSLDMNGSTAGAVSQTFDTNAGAQYEVRFAMAGNPAGQPTIKPLRVSAAGAQADYVFDITGRSLANMGWAERLFLFTAAGPTTTLEFRSLATNACCWGPAIDNVRVAPVQVVPEPAFFSLLASGLAAFGLRRRQ